MRLVLASASPRRKAILALAGLSFTVKVSEADETCDEKDPAALVRELSFRKAKAVAQTFQEENREAGPVVILGADTVVAFEKKILGKPQDEEDAYGMLSLLSGKTHQVYTGVTLLWTAQGEIVTRETFSEETDVMMRTMSEAEIRGYIATGEPMDKAGAYGIQGRAAVFVSGIRGDYYNVVGLPLCRTICALQGLQDSGFSMR